GSHRGLQEVGVRVRQDAHAPPSTPDVTEGAGNLREDRPPGKRPRQGVAFLAVQREALGRRHGLERSGGYLAIWRRRLGLLHERFRPVIGAEETLPIGRGPEPTE